MIILRWTKECSMNSARKTFRILHPCARSMKVLHSTDNLTDLAPGNRRSMRKTPTTDFRRSIKLRNMSTNFVCFPTSSTSTATTVKSGN